jgi:signal transduction histidine kinase
LYKKNLTLALLLILVIIASIIIITYFSEIQISKLQQATVDRRDADVNSLENTISNAINGSIGVMVSTSQLPQVNTPPLANLINSALHGIPQDTDVQRRAVAKDILENYKSFDTVSFLLPNGEVYMVEPYSAQLNLKQSNFAVRDYYKGAVSTQIPYLSEIITSQATGNKVAVISVPIFSQNQTLIGVWLGSLNLKFINDYVSSHYLGKTGLVAILDQHGNVVSRSSGLYLQNTTLKDLEIYKKAQNGNAGNDVETIENTKMFVSYSPITTSSSTWVLLIIRPYGDSFLSSDTATNQLYLMILGVIVIVTIFGLYVRKAFNSVNRFAQKLDSTNEELVRIDRAKDEFAAMLAHELKTPLVPIQGYVDILLGEHLGKINETQKNRLEIIKESASNMLRLISDILDSHKLELGQLKIVKNENNIRDTVEKSIDTMLPFASDKKVELKNHVTNDIIASYDEERIKQVITNLIKNGINACKLGIGKIEIFVEDSANDVKLSITDNGIGIPNGEKDKIFKKFYQMDTSLTRENEGSGLGLAICKGIVRLMEVRCG